MVSGEHRAVKEMSVKPHFARRDFSIHPTLRVGNFRSHSTLAEAFAAQNGGQKAAMYSSGAHAESDPCRNFKSL